MVKWTSVWAREAEKTSKTKWELNCGTPCTLHLTSPAPVTWDRKELRKEKGEKVFCAGAGARVAASSRRELRSLILPLAVRGGLQHYPGYTLLLCCKTLVITSHNGGDTFIVSCWASLSQYSATIKVSLLASYRICISAAALCVFEYINDKGSKVVKNIFASLDFMDFNIWFQI